MNEKRIGLLTKRLPCSTNQGSLLFFKMAIKTGEIRRSRNSNPTTTCCGFSGLFFVAKNQLNPKFACFSGLTFFGAVSGTQLYKTAVWDNMNIS